MLSKIKSISVVWLECNLVEVETFIANWMSAFSIVWLWDTAVQESKERVRAAIKNTWYKFPNTRITINLSPADIKKKWPWFDLPIAIWILISAWFLEFSEDFLENTLFIWELALDWKIKHVPGILSASIFAKENWYKRIFLSEKDQEEAAMIEWVEIFWFKNLNEIINFSNDPNSKKRFILDKNFFKEDEKIIFEDKYDFKYIKWQEKIKRALEISAAWSHNILMNWSPWSWKTLMAKSLQTILPKLTLDEKIELTKIYSIANKLEWWLISIRPFRTIHHTASPVSIVWWWTQLKPWEISLAHRWILFLDEFAEFPTNVLEVLRQPIEDKKISISRASWTVEFPSQFTLVSAMNPCYCGYYNVPNSWKECTCSAQMISKYQKKISWPLLDRIDIYCDVSPIKYDDLKDIKEWESSEEIWKRVQISRDIQIKRFKNFKWINSNSEMSHAEIWKYCELDDTSDNFLKLSVEKYNLSARWIHRLLKLARTIADLDWNEKISFENLAEAVSYRVKIWEN